MFAAALPQSGRAHAARLARAFRPPPSKPLPFFTPAPARPSAPSSPFASSSAFFSSSSRVARTAPAARSAAGLAGLRLSLRTIAPGSLRALHSSGRVGAQLGRIRPKRVAVIDGEIVDGLPKPSIWRPIVFAIGLTLAGFSLAALYVNRDTAIWLHRMSGGSTWRFGRDPSDRDLQNAARMQRVKRAQETLNTLPKTLGWLPDIMLVPVLRLYVIWEEWKINTPAAHSAPAMLIGGMGAIFLAWQVPRLQPFMSKWFMHRSVVFGGSKTQWKNCVTMFTSTISHQSLAHFAFNSIALYSFGSAAYMFLAAQPAGLPHESTTTHTPHFYAFLLAAGMFSSLGSHLYTNIARLPRLLRTLASPARLSSAQALAAHQAILPSLGASGAIYGALTMTALAYPDSHVSIIFLPFISIPIGWGVFGMVAVDAIGIWRGWRMFDHVAHFCGAMFGVIYYKWGREWWWKVRRTLGAHIRQ